MARLYDLVRGSHPGDSVGARPWYAVPADNKWFTRLIVAAAIVLAVEELDLAFPKIDAKKRKNLLAARAELAREP